MTKYSETFFDSTTGVLEQLVLGATAQWLANQDYLPDNFQTDFTRNAVSLAVRGDLLGESTFDAPLPESYLDIVITLPITRYNAISLSNIVGDLDLSRRIQSINPVDVDTLAFAVEPSYPQNSFPVNLPPYLLDFASPNYEVSNILERRLMHLCVQMMKVKIFEQNYNILTERINIGELFDEAGQLAIRPLNLPDTPTLRQERADYVAALIDLNSMTLDVLIFPSFINTLTGSIFGSEGASEQADYYSGIDPASESSKLSDTALNLLDNSASAFGSVSDSSPSIAREESPTLKDC